MRLNKLCLLTLLSLSFSVNAGFINRGNGMIYDSDQNLTWLQDASASGPLNWNDANSWAANLVYNGVSNWRLPSMASPSTTVCDLSFFNTNCGFNVNQNSSELAYLLQKILGNQSVYTPFGTGRGGANGVNWGLSNSGPFTGLLPSMMLWTSTAYTPYGLNLEHPSAWLFNTYDMSQGYGSQQTPLYAWAVRDGDVATTPVPAAVWLFGSSLLAMSWIIGKRKS